METPHQAHTPYMDQDPSVPYLPFLTNPICVYICVCKCGDVYVYVCVHVCVYMYGRVYELAHVYFIPAYHPE